MITYNFRRVTAVIVFVASVLAGQTNASQWRRVAALHFTALSCGPCGVAAYALERLKSEVGDSLNVIGIHYYDQYKIPEAESLAAHYSVVGTPTTWFDGADVQYYADTATYWNYRNAFDKRKLSPPLLDIHLSGWVDTSEGNGCLTITLANASAETLSFMLRTAVLERAIYRPWGGGDSVYDVLRDMLPGFSGPQLRLAPGADSIYNFSFQISSNWVKDRIELSAWAEEIAEGARSSSSAILQSNRVSLTQLVGLEAKPPPQERAIKTTAAIYPNPIRRRGVLEIFLSRPGTVGVFFYNAAGQRLGSLNLGWLSAGEHQVALESEGWPSGPVFCVVKTNSGVLTIKANKLK